ncbi:hypothetical protein [Methanoculleus chikugoensis]|uniref:hypothetical protein n=1 Tax=Methanoculleus chikugoensis TaxID=118126 RepID=UPI001FB3C2DD|nr:hypothetical protein [Methanoculleus chikugoensis]
MNKKQVRRGGGCGASEANATLPPSSFASSWKPTATTGTGGASAASNSRCPLPADAGDTIALRPRWDENLPGTFRTALFRDDGAIRNPGRTPSDLFPCGSSSACRSFSCRQRDVSCDLLPFAHERHDTGRCER